MRPLISILALVGLAHSAHAERLVFLPIGDRYANNILHYDAYFEGLAFGNRWSSIGTGFGNSFDAEIQFENTRTMRTDQASLDLSYNYVPSLPDLGFGVSFGIEDITNQTVEGRSVYVAVTARFNNFDAQNADTPTELTLGGGVGRYKGLFVGTRLPLTNQWRILAEFDSRKAMGGIEFAPTRGIMVRWLVRDQQTLLGASFLTRF